MQLLNGRTSGELTSGLKNAIEWCVSTTVFSDKPIGLITASASGQKGHEDLTSLEFVFPDFKTDAL
jgi:NAD(P)H-dependent FMN reductase